MFTECSSELQVNTYVYDKCIVLRAASVTRCTQKSFKNLFTDQSFHENYITEHSINHTSPAYTAAGNWPNIVVKEDYHSQNKKMKMFFLSSHIYPNTNEKCGVKKTFCDIKGEKIWVHQ